MNCLRFLGNKLSILHNSNRIAFSYIGKKNFSSIFGFSSVNNSLINDYSKSVVKTNLNLTPISSELMRKCGIKVYGKPKLRCKHCYYAGIEGVLHVFCSKYPRHKQRAFIPGKKKYGWILTHACQSKYRPY